MSESSPSRAIRLSVAALIMSAGMLNPAPSSPAPELAATEHGEVDPPDRAGANAWLMSLVAGASIGWTMRCYQRSFNARHSLAI